MTNAPESDLLGKVLELLPASLPAREELAKALSEPASVVRIVFELGREYERRERIVIEVEVAADEAEQACAELVAELVAES